jgi:integrase
MTTPKPPTGRLEMYPGARGDLWRAKLRFYDESGKAKPKTVTIGKAWLKKSRPPEGYLTKRQAEVRLNALLEGRAQEPAAVAAPPEPEESGVTFGQIAREHLHYVEFVKRRKRSTVNDYRRQMNAVLIPALGEDTPAESIDTEWLERWQEEMLESDDPPRKPRTINKHVAQVSAIYKRAVKVHKLLTNPALMVERLPEEDSGDLAILEPDEVLLVASKMGEQDAVLVIVAAFAGLRLSELRALRREDIRWGQSLILVRQGHVEGHDDTPKGKKVRSVPLSEQAAQALARIDNRAEYTADHDRVFVGEYGGAIDDSALRRRWAKALKAAGLPHFRLHDLRHTFGSLAVREFDLPAVQRMMGHKDIATTMRYVHHVPRHDDAARLTRLFSGDSDDDGSTVGPSLGIVADSPSPQTAAQSGEDSAGGGTRTPDTRIMIPLL